jgi:hypothetical protein
VGLLPPRPGDRDASFTVFATEMRSTRPERDLRGAQLRGRSGLLARPAAQADGPAGPLDVHHLATLRDLDLTLSHELGGGRTSAGHERAEVSAGNGPCGVGGTDRLAGPPASEQLEDGGAQAILITQGATGRFVSHRGGLLPTGEARHGALSDGRARR